MSTPATAVAALPHYHHPHGHHSNHHVHQDHPAPPFKPSSYRPTAHDTLLHPPIPSGPEPSSSSSLSSSSRTGRLFPPKQSGSLPGGHNSSDGMAQNHQSQIPPPPPPHGHYLYRDHVERPASTLSRHHIDHSHSPTMASMTASATTAVTGPGILDPPSRKRRRSREPDWNNFYRNGLPREIIVIDDTPEPEANTGRKLTPSNSNGHVSAAGAPYETYSNAQQQGKRLRREAATGYHVQYTDALANTSRRLGTRTQVGSTLSSDRADSFLNTTAPTSLSSNSQYEEAPAPVPLKRKRTTRQQTASEAKRRDVNGLGGPFQIYKPPPYPPKKVSSVRVRVVDDVRLPTLPVYPSGADLFLAPTKC